jgi:hypothetical protein
MVTALRVVGSRIHNKNKCDEHVNSDVMVANVQSWLRHGNERKKKVGFASMVVSSGAYAHVRETLHLPRGHIGRAVVALLRGAWHTPPVSSTLFPPRQVQSGLLHPKDVRQESDYNGHARS